MDNEREQKMYYDETLDSIQEDLRELMEKHKELTADGWGVGHWCRYNDSRNELINGAMNVRRAKEWISKFSHIKRANRKFSSYTLKHILERERGYITNGEMIAGAMLAGFIPSGKSSLNCFFNISSRELKRHIRENSKLADVFKDLL